MKRNIHLLGLITWLVMRLIIPENARPPVLALLAENEPGAPQNFAIHLPLVFSLDTFDQVPAIWAPAGNILASEVVLFRNTFITQTQSDQIILEIFADTRYEVWVDGKWLGRGPARFMTTWREYDRYQLDSVPAGEHLIAVMVQWAPNMRRSESSSPLLQARLYDVSAGSSQIISTTGSNWLCQISDAWRKDSAPIAPYSLIGPSELLDLRLLNANWFLPGAVSGNWLPAVVVDANPTVSQIGFLQSQVVYDLAFQGFIFETSRPTVEPAPANLALHYQPRSIPTLAELPKPVSVLDSGALSPGFRIGEIPPGTSVPYTLFFNVAQTVNFTVEMLSSQSPDANLVQIDSAPQVWLPAGTQRPDVYTSSLELPPGWHHLKFNEIPDWGMTFSVSTASTYFPVFPFTQSVHAGKRTMLAQTISTPGSVTTTQTSEGLNIEFLTPPAYVVLDLGRTVHGRMAAQINGQSGAVVDVGWDERLHDNLRPLPYPGSLFPEWNQVDSWILDGSARSLSTLDSRAGRYILITVWGDTPVSISSLQVLEETSLVSQSGFFSSSDPDLERIWQVGVDSMVPNLTDAYTDTPWRERGQWWGDAYVEDHVLRLVSSDPDLMRRGLRLMAHTMLTDPAPAMAPRNNGLHMLDYSMLWVHNLSDFVQSTGELNLAVELYPTVQRFMEHLSTYESPETGLLDLPKLHWSQTAYIDSWCVDCRYGQSTPLNSLYYSTLIQASSLATLLNDTSAAAIWQSRAQTVKASINTLLYHPEENRYYTTLYAGEFVTATPHAQAWPLAYGITPQGEIPLVTTSLMEILSKDPTQANIQPYGMFWLLEALGKNGFTALGLEVIDRYYGYLLDAGATTWWESFEAGQKRTASLSHAWGGAPTWFLTTYLLGLERTGPDSYQFTPALYEMPKVSGSIPLQNGDVAVAWQTTPCAGYRIDIQAAAGAKGQIRLPMPESSSYLTLDDQTLWPPNLVSASLVEEQDNQILLSITGGEHQLVLTANCP